MLDDRTRRALVRRFQTRLATIAASTAAGVATAWDRQQGRDRADVADFTRNLTRLETAGRAAAVATATGFYSTILSTRPPAITARAIDVALDTRAPFIAYWNALQRGEQWSDAIASGRARAEAVGEQLVISTARRTGDAVVEATGQRVVGWRRVLTGTSCDWCEKVATQRYRTSESADFGHDRCDCTAVPIIGDFDPGRILGRSHTDDELVDA